MSGGGEVIGDMVSGAMLSRAAEPDHGEGVADHTHEQACLNCGTPLLGTHCHQCGQAAHVHRTLLGFLHDLLHGVFHFEGKIWRTLPMLAWKPGQLTREYIDGRRASYVSPIALFLFVVFLTFAVFNATGGDAVNINSKALEAGAAQAETDAKTNVAQLEKELAEAQRSGNVPPGLEGQVAGARGALAGIQSRGKADLPETIATADGAGDQAIADRLNKVWRNAKANPELAVFKLQSNAYKFSWLLIPLSVPFMWLLFPFSRRFHLYDHTVFVTYSLCFMMVLLSLATLGAVNQTLGWLTAPAILYAPFHLYRQLRGAYGLSRCGALLRMLPLLLFAQLVLVLWGLVLLALVATTG